MSNKTFRPFPSRVGSVDVDQTGIPTFMTRCYWHSCSLVDINENAAWCMDPVHPRSGKYITKLGCKGQNVYLTIFLTNTLESFQPHLWWQTRSFKHDLGVFLCLHLTSTGLSQRKILKIEMLSFTMQVYTEFLVFIYIYSSNKLQFSQNVFAVAF